MRTTIGATIAARKALALLAGGLVLGVGVGATTLASWTDHESVWGGTGDTSTSPGSGPGGGLAASLFNMQQSTDGGTTYVDGNPSGKLKFSIEGATLSPDTTTYAYVLLRATARSVGGTVTLAGATQDPSGGADLFAALRYGAHVGGGQSDCTRSGYAGSGTVLVPDGTSLGTGSRPTTFHLSRGAAAGTAGDAVGVCFAVTLPNGTSSAVSGQQVTPTWQFDAISD